MKRSHETQRRALKVREEAVGHPPGRRTLLRSQRKPQVESLDFTGCGQRNGSTWIATGSDTPDPPGRGGSAHASRTSAGYTEQDKRQTGVRFPCRHPGGLLALLRYQDSDPASPQASAQTRQPGGGQGRSNLSNTTASATAAPAAAGSAGFCRPTWRRGVSGVELGRLPLSLCEQSSSSSSTHTSSLMCVSLSRSQGAVWGEDGAR